MSVPNQCSADGVWRLRLSRHSRGSVLVNSWGKNAMASRISSRTAERRNQGFLRSERQASPQRLASAAPPAGAAASALASPLSRVSPLSGR